MKEFRYFVEYAGMSAIMTLLGILSPDHSSALAGKIGRHVGPRLAASRKALANLQLALPDKSDKEHKAIIAGMWDNMARVISEYPNLEYFAPDVVLCGVENLKEALEKHGQVILFSGHLANWEIMAPCLLRYGLPVDLVYRAPNNPWSDRMLDRYRSLDGKLRTLPKSKSGTRKLVESLRDGRSVGILIDQKYNEGLEVPFFTRPAMTSPAFVQLAQKYHCGLVPFRVERVEDLRFRLSFYPALQVLDAQEQTLPVTEVIAKAHLLLESWITETPEQWLWLHRRWVSNDSRKNPNRKNSQPLPSDHPQPAA